MKALRKLAMVPVLLVAAWLALPQAVLACATCYGAADAPQTKGMNNAILTLILVVGVVYVGIGRVLLDFRRRSKKLAEKATVRPRLRLIHGEKR